MDTILKKAGGLVDFPERTTKSLTLDSWCPGRDSIRESLEYDSKALPLSQNARYVRYRSRLSQRKTRLKSEMFLETGSMPDERDAMLF
jgi:hypothetical protein